jgi:hypothetical protein
MYGKSLGLTADGIENEFGSNHMEQVQFTMVAK